MIPQYAILTLAEVMFNVTGLAFFYSQAPESMKSVIQACWLLTNSLGNALVMLIVGNNVFDSQSHEFFFFSTLMAVAMFLFMYLAHKYKMVNYKEHKEDSPE